MLRPLPPALPSAWLVKTRRAPSRHSSDARIYGHTTTAMHKLSTPPPTPLPLRRALRYATTWVRSVLVAKMILLLTSHPTAGEQHQSPSSSHEELLTRGAPHTRNSTSHPILHDFEGIRLRTTRPSVCLPLSPKTIEKVYTLVKLLDYSIQPAVPRLKASIGQRVYTFFWPETTATPRQPWDDSIDPPPPRKNRTRHPAAWVGLLGPNFSDTVTVELPRQGSTGSSGTLTGIFLLGLACGKMFGRISQTKAFEVTMLLRRLRRELLLVLKGQKLSAAPLYLYP